MFKAWTIACGVIVSRVYTAGWKVFARDVGRNKLAMAMRGHHPIGAGLDQAHNGIGIEDCHMLIIDIWLTATQEVGQVNGQKTYFWQTCRELLGHKLGDILLFAMTIGISGSNFWYRDTQVGAFG